MKCENWCGIGSNLSTLATAYDHRIKNLIAASGNPYLFPEMKIPRSTSHYWIKKGTFKVKEVKSIKSNSEELQLRIIVLEKELQKQKILLELFQQIYQVFKITLAWKRLSEKKDIEKALALIEKYSKILTLKECLTAIQFSLPRYKAWKKKQVKCELKDRSQCPKTFPLQLTPNEIQKIKEFVQSKDLSHFTINALYKFAQRKEKLFCSLKSWYHYINKNNWRRPRTRQIHPRKNKEGVRANAPNKIWHIDVSQIKLIDNTKCYIQAVIDNCSRYILAWHVSTSIGGIQTKKLLKTALKNAMKLKKLDVPELYVDGGTENNNKDVDQLIDDRILTRTIAQIDVIFSNSMIERLFYSLKNNFLYFQSLSSFNVLKHLVNYYFNEHNDRIPHSAFNGATPKEAFLGRIQENSLIKFKSQRENTIKKRIKKNKEKACRLCA